MNKDLYNFESIESGVSSMLSGSGGLRCYIARFNAINVTPRVEIEYSNGEAIHHIPLTTRAVPDMFRGTLSVVIVTDRHRNSGSHDIYRNTCRELLGSNHYFQASASLFPSKSIIDCEEVGTTNTVLGSDDDMDVSRLSFRTVVLIPPSLIVE
jgi:hypothetical protein